MDGRAGEQVSLCKTEGKDPGGALSLVPKEEGVSQAGLSGWKAL